MTENLKIKIIIGSTRPKRFSEHVAAWFWEIAKAKEKELGMEFEMLDLRDYPLPFYNEPFSPSSVKGDYPNPEANRWAKKIVEGDGFIIITPEYSHGYPAVLKNSLDFIFKEWNNKPVGFV